MSIYHLSSISFGFQPTFHPEALAWAAAGHTLGHHFRARAGDVPLLANGAANGCLSGPSWITPSTIHQALQIDPMTTDGPINSMTQAPYLHYILVSSISPVELSI